jgi:hypothetical protein
MLWSVAHPLPNPNCTSRSQSAILTEWLLFSRCSFSSIRMRPSSAPVDNSKCLNSSDDPLPREFVIRFLQCEKCVPLERIGVLIVECVIASVDRDTIAQFFPLFRHSLMSAPEDEQTQKLVIRRRTVCDKPQLIVDFIVRRPFRISFTAALTRITVITSCWRRSARTNSRRL